VDGRLTLGQGDQRNVEARGATSPSAGLREGGGGEVRGPPHWDVQKIRQKRERNLRDISTKQLVIGSERRESAQGESPEVGRNHTKKLKRVKDREGRAIVRMVVLVLSLLIRSTGGSMRV